MTYTMISGHYCIEGLGAVNNPIHSDRIWCIWRIIIAEYGKLAYN